MPQGQQEALCSLDLAWGSPVGLVVLVRVDLGRFDWDAVGSVCGC